MDRSIYDRALQAVLDRTDALRTVVRRVAGAPKAEVLDRMPYTGPFVDLSDQADPDRAMDLWARQHVDTLLDLSERSFEFTLIKLSDTRWAWAYLQHHLFSDATSMVIVFNRLSECYRHLAAGDDDFNPTFPDYAQYIAAERRQWGTDRYAKRRAYWVEKIADPPDPLTFYGGRSLSPGDGLATQRVDIQLGVDRSQAVRCFAKRKGVHFISDDLSLFSVFAAAYLAYLFRLSGQTQIAIGVPWQNRRRDFRETVGLLMEQNPFVISFDDQDTFESLIGKVRREAMGIMRHLPYPAGNPGGRVYDATFNYTKVSVDTFADMPIRPLWYRPSEGVQSLGLQIHDFGGSGDFSLSFEFNTELFEPSQRHVAITHFLKCLEACLADPTREIAAFDMLDDREHQQLDDWNTTAVAYPRSRTVVDLFEDQVSRRPSALAVRCGDESLSYRELDRRAAELATVLTAKGVGPGIEVGVCLERSPEMVVAVLAVMKAGAAYVPLDPAFPLERLAFMLEDSRTSVVITQSHLLDTLDPGELHVVCVDQLEKASAETDHVRSLGRAGPDDLAYVLYTSGSTGKPKGVEVPHRALTNFLWSMRDQPGCTEHDLLLAVTTLSFDIAGLELFLPLIVGGQVELATQTQAADGRLLAERLERGDVTILQATPSTWRMVLDAGWAGTPNLRALIGGEALPADLVSPLLERTKSLWNMYGPTETTIWSSVKQVVDAEADITIGTPIANTTFHILDQHRQHVPIGAAGELYIGGDGLARGYRNRPDLTAERFVPDPFGAKPGARLYRTGDLVRHRSDGEVVHLGRLDQQVKVRGFRVELGEIESALTAHPVVSQAAVLAAEDRAGRTRLVAYCATGVEAMPVPAVLRTHLLETLPHYMVPHQFIGLEKLPLTPNGKVDRRKLPDVPATDVGSSERAKPRSPVERYVAGLFAEILDLPVVGVDEDFFDLGGDSLLALQLMMRLEEHYQCRLPLHLLYEGSSVAALGEVVHRVAGLPRMEHDPGSGPISRTERRLAEIWGRVLGVPATTRGGSFLELQGDRNLVPDMLSEVRSEFGFIAEGISALDFAADPTIGGLGRLLDSNVNATSTLVVPLQAKGNRRPIFLLHAGGGYVFFYRALAARLGPDQPVYGVRALTRADSRNHSFDQSRSLQELAATYIQEIKTVQKTGPYCLGGASFGGVIAFEMAQQLIAAGESVASPLFLFDAFIAEPENWSPAPEQVDFGGATLDARYSRSHGSQERPTMSTSRSLRERVVGGLRVARFALIALAYSAVWKVRAADAVQRSLWAMRRLWLRRATFEVTQLKTTERFLEVTFQLLSRYRPTPYEGSAVLLRTKDGYDPEPGWRPLVLGQLDVHTVPGTHLEMFEEPGVIDTAALVRRHLDVEEQTRLPAGPLQA